MTNMLRCERRTLRDACVIAVVGIVFGALVNARLLLAALHPVASESDAVSSRSPLPVQLADVQTLLAQGARAVDARASEQYAAGHLPGAISLPLAAATDQDWLVRHLPQDELVITYCNGDGCSDGFALALKLLQAGIPAVRFYEAGWPEWRDRGLPVERGMP